MSSNPLSYDSLKTVIQYMDANLRYQLSCRIPSIHIVEKLIPLKFDSLEFSKVYTRVNETTYRVGVYRQYHESEETPKDHETENANGGIPFDLTEQGFETVIFTGDLTPGDIDIPWPGSEDLLTMQNRVFDREEQIFENRIKTYEKAVTMKLEQNRDFPVVRIRDLVIRQGETPQLDLVLHLPVEELREKIQYCHACLIPYRCRRDNTPLPFTPLMQITVESPTGTLVYRHRYTLKLHQAMKKLNTVLFGGRKCVFRSRSLNITEPLIVLRLPEGIRMRIQELQVAGSVASNYEALKSIVEETSYPLTSLTMTERVLRENERENHYEHSIVKSAETLFIKPFYDSSLPLLLRPKNKTTHIDCRRRPFPAEDQIRLVEHWLNEDKDVGTSLSYDIEGLKEVTRLLSRISRRFNGVREKKSMVVMPMSNGNRLEVSYTPIEQADGQDGNRKFRLDMRVVATPRYQTESVTWKIVLLGLRVSRFLF